MVTTSAQASGHPERRQRFVDDEICIVCSSRGQADHTRRDRMYELVRQFLNTAFGNAAVLPLVPTAYPDLRRALKLSNTSSADLLARIAGVGDLLLPLTRRPGQAHRALDRRDESTTHLHFYQLAPPPDDPRWDKDTRDRHIRELVLFINAELAGRLPGRSPDGSWQILGATPNWLAAVSEESGSPAAPPEAEARRNDAGQIQNWQFRFDGQAGQNVSQRQRLQRMVDDQRSAATKGLVSNVIVAVLDTCPERQRVIDAANAFPDNYLLQQVVGARAPGPGGGGFAPGVSTPSNPVRLEGRQSILEVDLRFKDAIIPDFQGHSAEYRRLKSLADNIDPADAALFDVADHGLFVAGIVKDIAPTAEIHLIRAKTDLGVTDFLTLVEVLSRLPNMLLRGKDDHRRLIVNLSLTVSVPTHQELLNEWGIGEAITVQLASGIDRHLLEIYHIHEGIHCSLREVIAWLGEKGVLVVAAAGNHNDRDTGSRPTPRLPAHYAATLDNVLAVAAMTLNDQPASYSNLASGSHICTEHGIAAIGGNTTSRPGGTEKQAIVMTRDEGGGKLTLKVDTGTEFNVAPAGKADAIRGIFSGADLPLDSRAAAIPAPPVQNAIGAGSNRSGWVDWAGTSFSTPIISAIAAVLWDRYPDLSPAELISMVQSFADIPLDALNCYGIHAEQVQL